MTTGYIPKTIRYVSRPAVVITPLTKYLKPGEEPEEIKVAPTKVVDAANSKTSANALRWAGEGQTGVVFKNVELPNREIPFIEIFEGGYKGEFQGRILDRFYVTIRPDVIYEALVFGEVRDGKIMGPFIWANSGGMNLVKKGSKLHREIELAQDRRYKKVIKAEKLVEGAIYLDRHGNRHAYLGEFAFCVDNRTYNNITRQYDSRLSWTKSQFFVSPSAGHELFEDFFSSKEIEDPANRYEKATHLDWLNHASEYRSPKVIGEPVGTFDIPADITARIRAMAAAEAERRYEATVAYNQQYNRGDTGKIKSASYLAHLTGLTFRRADEPMIEQIVHLPELPPAPVLSATVSTSVRVAIDDPPLELPDDMGIEEESE